MKMEQNPNFKVVGSIENEHKELIENDVRGLLYENHLANMDNEVRNELEENELPKADEELKFIEMANAETNLLLNQAGVKAYDVPERNFHKIKQELYSKYKPDDETSAGFYESKYQMILLNAGLVPKNRLYEALAIFHELLHMKSYLAYHAVAEEEGSQTILHTAKYREGVDVKSAQIGDKHEHFFGLNEAIVSYEEKKYLQKFLQSELFESERKALSLDSFDEAKEHLEKEQGISQDEFIYINPEENYYLSIGYQPQRKVLDYVCEEIAKDTGQTAEDIHNEFLKSQLTGKLLTVAHLAEDSFGTGSFRELGEMTDEKKTATAAMDFLHSSRLQKFKSGI